MRPPPRSVGRYGLFMMRFLLLFTVCVLCGCAYSYAGKDGKTREEESIRQDVKVVEIKKDEKEKKNDSLKPMQTSKVSDSPCGIAKFSIFFYEKGSRVEKVIDCKARKVVETKQDGFETALYDDAQASNIPAKTWYFLVDPHGNQTTVTNEHLIKLSREFQIEFFGRHEKKNLLIYTFLDSLD